SSNAAAANGSLAAGAAGIDLRVKRAISDLTRRRFAISFQYHPIRIKSLFTMPVLQRKLRIAGHNITI
ncbi:MAG: hypothetical protein ACREDM_15150, partial [Methylocella sp.]